MGKEMVPEIKTGASNNRENSVSFSSNSSGRVSGVATCRVCQCLESDKRGDAALEFLGIVPPLCPAPKCNDGDSKVEDKTVSKDSESAVSLKRNVKESRFVELISPDGEVLVCNDDLEMGLYDHDEDTLIELGCLCKSDLALVHYACALKWFVNHGSTVCEICGHVAKNIRAADFRKVIGSLKEYEALRERTASGEPNPAHIHTNTSVDPDALAAIRRQRLSEISLWFGPRNHGNNSSVAASEAVSEPSLNTVAEEGGPAENTVTKWAVEGTGILLATGLLTVTLAWLIAPRVGKAYYESYLIGVVNKYCSQRGERENNYCVVKTFIKPKENRLLPYVRTAKSGLHILLGGFCALTVVVFFRFFVLTRIKHGPARYWAILFVFWFLVFGIWASRTHGAHTT